MLILWWIPRGRCLHNYATSQCLMGKLIISMFIFNSYVELPEGTVDFTSIHVSICSLPLDAGVRLSKLCGDLRILLALVLCQIRGPGSCTKKWHIDLIIWHPAKIVVSQNLQLLT